MSVQIREFSPTEALIPFIVHYWEGIYCGSASAALYQKIAPTCYIDFILHLSDARCEIKLDSCWQTTSAFHLDGFWTSPFDIRFWDRVETFNIRFKPEAMYFLFGIPAAEFLNNPDNLEDVLGTSIRSFCLQLEAASTVEERIRLADAYLLDRMNKIRRRQSYVQLASDLIRHQHCEISVHSLSREVCISPRQLEREFKNMLGISPKTYMRMARLNMVQQMIARYPQVSLAQLAYLCGYADQAHFVKDFKKLTGEPPSVYIHGKGKAV